MPREQKRGALNLKRSIVAGLILSAWVVCLVKQSMSHSIHFESATGWLKRQTYFNSTGEDNIKLTQTEDVIRGTSQEQNKEKMLPGNVHT